MTRPVLKPWILPSGNDFIKDPGKRHIRPEGDPGSDFPLVQRDFDDSSWKMVDLPHDWAIEGPFITGRDFEVGGGMGRLPSPGVGWYEQDLRALIRRDKSHSYLAAISRFSRNIPRKGNLQLTASQNE